MCLLLQLSADASASELVWLLNLSPPKSVFEKASGVAVEENRSRLTVTDTEEANIPLLLAVVADGVVNPPLLLLTVVVDDVAINPSLGLAVVEVVNPSLLLSGVVDIEGHTPPMLAVVADVVENIPLLLAVVSDVAANMPKSSIIHSASP